MGQAKRKEQHYAVSTSGRLVHIDDAHNSSEEFYCPYCDCKMIKKCGIKNKWHFAHDYHFNHEVQKQCSYETYLHAYAKMRLKQWFDEANNIDVKYQQSIKCKFYDKCKLHDDFDYECIKTEDKSFNLKRTFNQCEIEATTTVANDIFRADLLLTSDNNDKRLLLEIKVSHGCSEKKISSGVPIIEFDVTSEEDVENIAHYKYIKESEKIRFYGFKTDFSEKEKDDVKPKFDNIQKFVLYNSGKTYINPKCNCKTIHTHNSNSIFEIITEKMHDYQILKIYGLIKAHEAGFNHPNCLLCTHCSYSNKIHSYACTKSGHIVDEVHDAHGCYYMNVSDDHMISRLLPINVLDMWSTSGIGATTSISHTM